MPIILPDAGEARDHLIIPDSHAYPGDKMQRYKALGNYIMEKRPSVIVNIGDWWEMGSLCSYDKGKKSYVFKNIKDDIEAGHEAEEYVYGPIEDYNKRRSRFKKKQYRPTVVKVIGNHEERVNRLLEYDSKLDGMVSMDEFKTRKNIKEVYSPFLEVVVIDGVAYSHYFVSGTMGRPCGSARVLVNKKHMSTTMGHTHLLDTHADTKPTGEMVRGLICGSFHEDDHKSFAGPQTDQVWWNGVIHKRNVIDGDYDMEEISVTRLEDKYL
jgi:hypothetical protein